MFEIKKPIDDVLMLYKNQLKSESIEIEVVYHTRHLDVLGDENGFIGIFQNLLSNSRDAFLNVIDKRKRVISFDIYACKSPFGIKVDYRDNAGGMPAEVVAQIFEPYYTTKEEGAGTGLGMSIANQVAEDMGGKIQVESTLGQGTHFELLFKAPTSKQKKDQSTAYFPKPDAMAFQKIPSQYYQTLVIDDEPIICEYLKSSLGPQFIVTQTSDAKDAMDLIHQNHYDLVITDLKMPVYSGIAIAEAVKEKNKQSQLAFVTGELESQKLHLELKSFEPYILLCKPFPDAEEIGRVLSEFVITQIEEAA